MTSELAISMKNITKKYDGKTALNELTLSVNRGEIFGLLGHNGAGKTTTEKRFLTGILEENFTFFSHKQSYLHVRRGSPIRASEVSKD